MTYHPTCEFKEQKTQFLTVEAANVASTESTNARKGGTLNRSPQTKAPEGSGITKVILESRVCITPQNFKPFSQHLYTNL